MELKVILSIMSILILLSIFKVMADQSQYTDINMEQNSIYNATYVNSTYFYQNGMSLNATIDDRSGGAESDPYWTANQSSYWTGATIESFGYYNLSDFNINDYYLKSNPYGYYNDTTLVETDPYWTANQSKYWTGATIESFGYYNLSDFDINNYYTKSESDSNFVDVSGDTMTGALKFNNDTKAYFGSNDNAYIVWDSANEKLTIKVN